MMTNVKIFLIAIMVGLLLAGAWLLSSDETPVGAYSFKSLTHASSSIGHYAWVQVATSTLDQGFHRICDAAVSGVNANNPIYLAFAEISSTTTPPTPPYGLRLGSGECYQMTEAEDNLFYGRIFARASTSTSTLLQIYK